MKRHKTTTRLTLLPTLLLIAGVAQPVHACRVPPQPQLSAQEQVARATDVALVRVVRALPRPTPAPRRPSDTPAWVAAHQGWNPALPDSALANVGDAHYLASYPVEYTFEVEKRWRGAERNTFTLTGTSPPATYFDPGPEANQGREEFWEPGGGRFGRQFTCRVDPWFIVGERYVVFVGEPVIARSYEHVATIEGRANPGDKWLRYIEAALGAPTQAGKRE
ncbi:hypothetical protein [Telluria beijingensis]|uniref:hypothetical protein n=1 Tax=Telluria beijingensis TaxID=3068633 RepID=UPI00279591CF|nr:hypothetical protein [Massilia sp. REN29]